jgi:5-methylcytosine-specific restriction enzyme A
VTAHRQHTRLGRIESPLGTIDLTTAKVPVKRADPFYLTPAWRSLMTDIIKQRGRQCQECGRINCRIFGDHIIELKDGGAELDPANIKLLCGMCHSRKTAARRADRASHHFVATG